MPAIVELLGLHLLPTGMRHTRGPEKPTPVAGPHGLGLLYHLLVTITRLPCAAWAADQYRPCAHGFGSSLGGEWAARGLADHLRCIGAA